jgi:CO/xanthine dehydrogenase FAD-binding subunit
MSVLVPPDLESALAALAAEPDALVLAGGTDLMVAVNAGTRRFQSVVALRRIAELHEVVLDEAASMLRVGAGVTYTRLLAEDVKATAPALAQAARTVGSPQIRNAGTIGGNLGTASPAGDTLPVLVALGADVELASARGRRPVPGSAVVTGVKQTVLEPGELITAVRVPVIRSGQEFRKVGVRNAMVIAVASVAVVVDAAATAVRVAMGSVGPVVLRAPEAETWVASRLTWHERGAALADPADADGFGRLVAAAAQPIDDHRSTADYRRHAVGVLAARCLRSLAR